jgi:hypothetical protein
MGVWSLALALAVTAGACSREALPEAGSYPAQLYTERCGGCHAPYDPRSMTIAMWQVQVDAMGPLMAAGRVAPLSPGERKTILDYLRRNAAVEP